MEALLIHLRQFGHISDEDARLLTALVSLKLNYNDRFVKRLIQEMASFSYCITS